MALIKNLSATAVAMAMLATISSAGAQPVDTKPAPETYCKPQYPRAALRAQVQGVTTVAFHVDAQGKVTQAEILKSSGSTREHRLLDEETVCKLSLCLQGDVLDRIAFATSGSSVGINTCRTISP